MSNTGSSTTPEMQVDVDGGDNVGENLVDPGTAELLDEIDFFEPFGWPYDANQATWSLSLPKSVFSSVFMLHLSISEEMQRTFHFVKVLYIPQFMLYAIVLVTQFSFLVYLYDITKKSINERDNTCEGGDRYLRMLCFAVIVAAILQDVQETINMFRWIQCVPTWNEEMHPKIIDECCYGDHEGCGMTKFPFQKYKNREGIIVEKPAVGFTHFYRASIFTFVLLPKFLFAISLIYLGGGFLAIAESNSDLILNAVALTFILEVDDIFYDVLTPSMFKLWLETNFTITFGESEENEAFRYLPYGGIAVIGACVAGLYKLWC